VRRRQSPPARRPRLSSRALLVPLVVLVGVGVGLLVAPGAQPRPARATGAKAAPVTHADSRQMANLPAPAKGIGIPRARQLGGGAEITKWAPVLRATDAHARPSWSSPVVVPVSTLTPEGTSNLIVADGEVTRDGVSWVHARLAVLPDGRTGWLPRSALGGWSFVDTRVVVDRANLTLTLYRDGTVEFRTPVGVGKPGTPTPAGQFYVRDRLTSYASPEYGPLAFGTSARSEYETDWPAGGFIGIHGTDQPQLIPGRISHGCIRLRNAAILKLGRLMPVGTPVTIR
jgi:lipoprotein-anchoring transpeptidase ErfK/SrfK